MSFSIYTIANEFRAGKTQIQTDEAIQYYIGKEFSIDTSIRDISHSLVHVDYPDDICVLISYNSTIFKEQLKNFSKDDRVDIKAILKSAQDKSSIRDDISLHFDLVSIRKKDNSSDSNCFIATACFGGIECREVIEFRKYRDEKLRKTYLGNIFIKIYYWASPPIAKLIAKKQYSKRIIRILILLPLLKVIRHSQKKSSNI